MTEKRPARKRNDVDRLLYMALEDTFPASDPFSVGHATGTEPPTRPVARRPPVIDAKRVRGLARKVANQRQE